MTDANGLVSTTVTSGFRATTVRITAEADSNGDGIPDNKDKCPRESLPWQGAWPDDVAQVQRVKLGFQ